MTDKKTTLENQVNQIEEQQNLPERDGGEVVNEEFANNERFQKEPSIIVGIGASAGGLEAFTRLLEKLPSDSGMAFVLVQHLDPKHKSALTDILSRSTSMPVVEVENKTVVKPDYVYIIPPGKIMSVSQGVLNLVPREDTTEQRMLIDFFLESLAKDQGSKAIGVILSGTASDGSRGLKEIKTAGGITFVQKPQTAKFDSMPLNAIATGAVDFVLELEEIAFRLAQIAEYGIVNINTHEAGNSFFYTVGELNHVFKLLKKAYGTDFSEYKDSTIKRRLLRRMVLHKIDKLDDYFNYLRQNPVEVEELYQDILINVTNFFRDPEAFEALKKQVFPHIIEIKLPGEPVRVWAPACSTGEEAYSLAIALVEYFNDANPIQIFATDINEKLIMKARTGIYSKDIENDVSPDRLHRFFVEVNEGYQISKAIRDMIVFAKHDMINEPPFSRLDLVSCRNAIIYFGLPLHKKIFPLFHYALTSNGFLFLGSSESVGAYENLFNLIDKKHKIFSKKSVATPLLHEFKTADYVAVSIEPHGKKRPVDLDADFNVIEAANSIVLNKYAPVGVIINSDFEVIHFRGRTGNYLEPASGKPTLKLINLARNGLALGLYSALKKSMDENAPVRKEGLQVVYNGTYNVNIDVVPIKGPSKNEKYFLVLFEKVSSHPLTKEKEDSSNEISKMSDSKEIVRLQNELLDTKEYLQSVIEKYETSNESLRAANEEIQSSNEELRSMNEELETTKEELQSTNEELMTLNDEIKKRNQELNRVSGDLNNLFHSMDVPVIMLNSNFCIRLFNFAAGKEFNLLNTDVGRPITDININFDNVFLAQSIAEVNNTLISKGFEIQNRHGHWFFVKISPYRTLDNIIDGVSISFTDINDLKLLNEKTLTLSEHARKYSEGIVETMREPLLVLDDKFYIQSVNKAFLQTFFVSAEETLQESIFYLGNGQWDIPDLKFLLEEILSNNTQFNNFKVSHHFPHIGYRIMLINARLVLNFEKPSRLILVAIEDVTERMQAEESLRQSEERFHRIFQSSPDMIAIIGIKDNKYIDVNQSFLDITGYSYEEVVGNSPFELGLLASDTDKTAVVLEKTKEKIEIKNFELHIRNKSGNVITVLVSETMINLNNENCLMLIMKDITEIKCYQLEMSRLDRLSLVGEMAGGIAHEIRNPITSVRIYLQYLSEKKDFEKYVDSFQLMIDEMDRANMIITQYLTLARSKAYDAKPEDLNEIIKSLISLIETDAIKEDKNVNFELEDVPRLLLEESDIKHMILNLTRNGLEAMAPGGYLTVKTFTNGENVVLAVSDQGKGIPPEHIEKMGIPFFTTKDYGTGLGLAVCYKIAARHSATINIETSPAGTTFFVSFKVPDIEV